MTLVMPKILYSASIPACHAEFVAADGNGELVSASNRGNPLI